MRLIGAVLLLATPLQEEHRHKWAGFKEGSFATTRITQKGMRRESTTLQRTAIAKVDGDKVTLSKRDDQGAAREFEVSTKSDLKKLGTETIDVDGKAFACTIYEAVEQDKLGTSTIKVWMCKDAPGRIVKRAQTTAAKDDKKITGTGQLTKLGQKTEIDGTSVTYAIFEFKATGPEGYEAKITQWVSEQVPGFLVKEEHSETLDKMTLLRVTELVEFQVK